MTEIGFWVPGNHSWRGFRGIRERGTSRGVERYQTIRAYSAGGVVFRLAPTHTFGDSFTADYPHMDKECSDQFAFKDAILSAAEASSEASTGSFANWMTERKLVSDLHPTIAMEVVLVGHSHAGTWALPKGTPKSGETIEQVAIREAQEETGLQVQLIAYIGNITYSFVRDQIRYQKQVRHFLLEAIGGDIALHDHEYDLVQWFPLAEASQRLTYHNEVHILYQAEVMLQRWRDHQQSQQ